MAITDISEPTKFRRLLAGLSTDVKPTGSQYRGNYFFEYNTGLLYITRNGTNWSVIATGGDATAAELAKVPKSDAAVTWNATALASINTQVDLALNTIVPAAPTVGSVNDILSIASGANTFNKATDSLEAIANAIIADRTRLLATATSTSALTTGDLFDFTGKIGIVSLIGTVTTIIEVAATTVQLFINADALAAYGICGATLDISGFAVGSLISITGTAADAAVGTTAVGSIAPGQALMVPATCITSGTISVTFGAASTGVIVWDILWIPLSAGATLVTA